MNPQLAQAALEFLGRITLHASEIQTYARVISSLDALARLEVAPANDAASANDAAPAKEA